MSLWFARTRVLKRLPHASPTIRLLGLQPGFVAALVLASASFAEESNPLGDASAEVSGPAPGTGVEREPEGDAGSYEEVELEVERTGSALDPTLGVEEIVITGEVMETVDDTSTSIVGFDPNVIKMEGIKDIRDLSNFTPSLEIKSAFAASNPTIFIRGIGLDDFNANSASAVAIYQDGVYMQSPAGQLFQFYDVEGVQVLRGPQPTLYRNAEAGAILVNSRKPTEEFEGYLTASYGNYNAIEVEGAVGGPIVPEWLLGRVSASWGVRDGLTKNRCAKIEGTCVLSQPAPDGSLQYQEGMNRWANDINAWAARSQLLLKLPLGETESEWLLNAHGGQNRSRALQYQHRGAKFGPVSDIPIEIGGTDENGYQDVDGDPFAGDYNLDGPERIDLFGSNLAGSWQFGDGYELRSLTAFEWHDLYRVENTDAGPKFILESEYEDSAWQLSQQLDLHGDWDSLIASEIGDGEWTIGGFYLQEDLEVGNFFDTVSGTAQHLTQEYTQKTRNFAAYALSEYRFQPGCTLLSCDFTLLVGFRYNVEHKSFDTFVCETGLVECDTITIPPTDTADTWTGPGGEVSLAWNYSASSNLYIKYARGWKGGHFNGSATSVFDIITGVEPETVDAFESGLRSFWLDDRLMVNATGFYYDYQNLQVFVIEQTELGYPIPKLVNATNAVVYGVELDLGASPLPGLDLTYNFAWVESEYADFVISFNEKVRPPRPCRTCPRPDPVIVPREFDYTGNRLIGSPRFSMTGSISYELPLPGTLFRTGLGTLTPRFSFSWKDDIFFDACGGRGQRCNFPEAFFGQKAFTVLNAALTWTSEDQRFQLTGWVRNFLDERYLTQNFDLTRGLGIILDAYADPRMFGLTATVSF
jgi:iron complex outermembrane receptor protein